MGKILVIASVVLSLATAGLGFVNKTSLGQTKQELADTQSAKQSAEQKTATAEKNLKAKTDELATATADKEQAVAQAAQAKSDLTKASADLAALNTKVSTTETQLAQANTELTETKTKLEQLQQGGSQNPAPADQTAELTTQLQEKETIIAKLQSELDSKGQIVKVMQKKDEDRQKQQLKKGTEGRVLAVNPAWNFVVLNLGDKQGLANNTELLVKRGTRFLGKVRITSVEPSTSIADIVANSMPQGTTISPGDNVIFQGDEE